MRALTCKHRELHTFPYRQNKYPTPIEISAPFQISLDDLQPLAEDEALFIESLSNARKLPKQFSHWCRSCGLFPQFSFIKGKERSVYLIGHHRFYRVRPQENKFDIGFQIVDFDKWTNSIDLTIKIPTSLAAFKEALKVISPLKIPRYILEGRLNRN